MGRVRTKTTKRSAKFIVEKYYPKLTLDFDTNKRITDEVAIVPSKRMRNKIAGYVTHLMRRMQKGPVRGVSIKLQEEERERRDNYVPDVSVIDQDSINIDSGAPSRVAVAKRRVAKSCPLTHHQQQRPRRCCARWTLETSRTSTLCRCTRRRTATAALATAATARRAATKLDFMCCKKNNRPVPFGATNHATCFSFNWPLSCRRAFSRSARASRPPPCAARSACRCRAAAARRRRWLAPSAA